MDEFGVYYGWLIDEFNYYHGVHRALLKANTLSCLSEQPFCGKNSAGYLNQHGHPVTGQIACAHGKRKKKKKNSKIYTGSPKGFKEHHYINGPFGAETH